MATQPKTQVPLKQTIETILKEGKENFKIIKDKINTNKQNIEKNTRPYYKEFKLENKKTYKVQTMGDGEVILIAKVNGVQAIITVINNNIYIGKSYINDVEKNGLKIEKKNGFFLLEVGNLGDGILFTHSNLQVNSLTVTLTNSKVITDHLPQFTNIRKLRTDLAKEITDRETAITQIDQKIDNLPTSEYDDDWIKNRLNGSEVKLGDSAGITRQGSSSVAIGDNAGNDEQGSSSVAIGDNAGNDEQGNFSVALGHNAGYAAQGNYSVAIGDNAGPNNQHNKTIVINANDAALNTTEKNQILLQAGSTSFQATQTKLQWNGKDIINNNSKNIVSLIKGQDFNSLQELITKIDQNPDHKKTFYLIEFKDAKEIKFAGYVVNFLNDPNSPTNEFIELSGNWTQILQSKSFFGVIKLKDLNVDLQEKVTVLTLTDDQGNEKTYDFFNMSGVKLGKQIIEINASDKQKDIYNKIQVGDVVKINNIHYSPLWKYDVNSYSMVHVVGESNDKTTKRMYGVIYFIDTTNVSQIKDNVSLVQSATLDLLIHKNDPIGDLRFDIQNSIKRNLHITLTNIPSILENVDRTTIPSSWYNARPDLTTVILNVATQVQDGAFIQSPITNFNAPKLETVGNNAFLVAPIISFLAPKIKTIGDFAFENSRMRKLILNDLTTVGRSAFADNFDLKILKIEACTDIGNNAFRHCPLEEIDIPVADSIGIGAFLGVINKSTTKVRMKKTHNLVSFKNTIFGRGNWDKITFDLI